MYFLLKWLLMTKTANWLYDQACLLPPLYERIVKRYNRSSMWIRVPVAIFILMPISLVMLAVVMETLLNPWFWIAIFVLLGLLCGETL